MIMPGMYPFSPHLAFSAGHTDCPARLDWARKNSRALEYSPDPARLDLLPEQVLPFTQAGIPVRFHTRYFGCEFGHADRYQARKALEIHQQTLKKIQGLGEPVVTVHTGLGPNLPVKEEHIKDNLSRLVEFASRLGITVCLENLRLGHAGNPCKILEWSLASGAMITLDTGHVFGCDMVRSLEVNPLDILEMFGFRLMEVHIYGSEDDVGHHPIKDIRSMLPLMNHLLQTECTWWTVELEVPGEAETTRATIEHCLESEFSRVSRHEYCKDYKQVRTSFEHA